MRAWVLEEFGGPLVRREIATPTIGPREALVRVRNVGICGTDLKIRAGRMGLGVVPLIMGHEVAGEGVATIRSVEAQAEHCSFVLDDEAGRGSGVILHAPSSSAYRATSASSS